MLHRYLLNDIPVAIEHDTHAQLRILKPTPSLQTYTQLTHQHQFACFMYTLHLYII